MSLRIRSERVVPSKSLGGMDPYSMLAVMIIIGLVMIGMTCAAISIGEAFGSASVASSKGSESR